ncbi:methyl-accepting chemotaxis protein [Pseudoalteromonas arctica]|mgnify:FL=1|uniref:Methyl-accepting chemotaxis protein n=1 Tax=Pseudoalteromonas arctica TaxID=394751 RepID=A0AAP6Y356_9GAMM|nr:MULTISPECIES: methyl-accepting chemotaxis protein [Pseudoalteromonas]MBG9999042.1 methyl-accepting chemotaxis protein [Pseudoalteromonas sp. NSLLW24]MBH0001354.1 methyl-accepting chemotaxis protein [Pseudoalteromonas sp. SWYJZ12]MBH0011905.1 methyl-accepting chemotaxis protein [Pseudoalteromonas sp. NZS100_1]MBH0047435.1 methyl-accepting chemotaxis protein [Pseudoalteromonas sp. NZS11_1]MBH0062908.1 methyl-accepting chemotaxis protein [Pseudoalteromonas sp. NZS71]
MLNSLKFTSKVTIAASLILVLVLGLFTFNNYIAMRKQTEQQLSLVLQQNSESVSQNIASWLNAKLAIVISIAKTHKANDSKALTLSQLNTAELAGSFKNTYIGKSSGTFILNDQSVVLPADFDATSRPWYKLVENKSNTAFTTPYIDVTTNELTISAVVPMLQNGQFSGVAGADIDMQTVTKIINDIDFLGLGYGFLLDNKGQVLSHPNAKLNLKNTSDIFGTNTPLQSEFTQYEINGESKLISFTKISGIENVDWYLGVVIDKDKAYVSVSNFGQTAAVFMVIGIITIIIMMQLLLRYLMQPMNRLNDAIKDIAQGEGDLTRRLTVENDDEFGDLSHSFNIFIEKIQHSIEQVKESTEQLDTAIESLVSQTHSSLSMYDDQSKRTDSVAAAINQFSATSMDISNNAESASQLAKNADEHSTQNQEALSHSVTTIHQLSANMEKAQQTINSLNTHTASIGQVLEVIKGVSEQTNLLALNAAIEAARAGEAGRGFAVVADEVRQLAHRTQQSTQEIEDTVSQLQKGSNLAVELMKTSLQDSEKSVQQADAVGNLMSHVIQAIKQINDANHSVASATDEQNQVVKLLDTDIQTISALSIQGKANLNDTLNECTKLKQQFSALENMVQKFKV